MLHAQVDTSYVVGIIVTCVFLLLALAGSVATGIAAESVWIGVGAWVASSAVIVGLFALIAWPPWPGQYNSYAPKSGIVAHVGNRFIASDTNGGGSTEKFAVQFTNGQTYGCNDTRCSVLRPGQAVTLLCERVFQWNSSQGWDCNFGAYQLNR